MKMKLTGLLVVLLMGIVAVSGFCSGNKDEIKKLNDRLDKVENAQKINDLALKENTEKINMLTRSIDELNRLMIGLNPPSGNTTADTVPAPVPVNGIRIDDSGSKLTTAKIPDIVKYIKNNNKNIPSNIDVQNLISVYFNEAEKEGINPDLAIAQMCYSTQFLKNQSLVSAYNYAGFAPINNVKVKLDNPTQGVQAHIQHLKGYSSNSTPQPLVDPRFNLIASQYRGKVITLNELSRGWAPTYSSEYVKKVTNILNDLYKI